MKNLLALVDFSELTDTVVNGAAEIAAAQDARCWLLHISPPDQDLAGRKAGPQYARDARADELREDHRELQRLKDRVTQQGVRCEALLVSGEVNPTIMEELDKLKIDMIVMGSHGRSRLYELLIGSTTEFVLRNANRPVLIIPAEKQG